MHDPESANESLGYTDSFGEKSIRLGFIRKVYLMLSVQMLVMAGIIAVFHFVEPLKKISQENLKLFYLAVIIYLALIFSLVFFENIYRRFPINLILSIIIPMGKGFLFGPLASRYSWGEEFLLAVGITAVVTVVLTCFSLQTKYDLTMKKGMLFVFFIVLFVFAILTNFVPTRILSLVYGSLGALLFSTYIVFDTQVILRGSHSYSISPEECIFASIQVFTDIHLINLCLFVFWIISGSKDNEIKD